MTERVDHGQWEAQRLQPEYQLIVDLDWYCAGYDDPEGAGEQGPRRTAAIILDDGTRIPVWGVDGFHRGYFRVLSNEETVSHAIVFHRVAAVEYL